MLNQGTARSRRRERRAQARRDAGMAHKAGFELTPEREAVAAQHREPLPPEAITALKGWAASNRAER